MELFSPWDAAATDVEEACRVEFELDGVRLERDASDVFAVPFERCTPVRSFPSWPHKRHYSGHQWMQRLGLHVPFESLAERTCLIELDRAPTLSGVASQPMWLSWPRLGARHAPDFFVRLADGTGLVIDVRPHERIDGRAREQFDRTARMCTALGLRYSVYSPASPVHDANLRFLMRYRDPVWHDPRAVLALPPGEHLLDEVARALNHLENPLATCYALIWHGDLLADLDTPLSLRTHVTLPEAA
jgi:hypothetical protein